MHVGARATDSLISAVNPFARPLRNIFGLHSVLGRLHGALSTLCIQNKTDVVILYSYDNLFLSIGLGKPEPHPLHTWYVYTRRFNYLQKG